MKVKEYDEFDHSFVSGWWTKIIACMLSKDKRLNEKAYHYYVNSIIDYTKTHPKKEGKNEST